VTSYPASSIAPRVPRLQFIDSLVLSADRPKA